MHVAERLYLSGYITYPRTETTSYASGFNFEEIVKKMIGKDNTLGSYA